MKTPTIGLLITFFTPLTLWGFQSFSWPNFCPQDVVQLQIKSKVKTEQNFWIEKWESDKSEWNSVIQSLKPSESKTLTSTNIPLLQNGFSLIFQQDNSVKAFAKCGSSGWIALQEVEVPQVKYQWFLPVKTLDIHIMSLSWSPQEIFALALDENGQTLSKQKVAIEKYYDTGKIHFEFPEGVQQVWLKSDSRFVSVASADGFWNSSVSPLDYQMSPMANKSYFLAAPRDGHGDSFVVSISDTAQIQQAQDIVRNPASEKIVVGLIESGNKGENRSFTRFDKAPYSWSMKSVSAFADFAHIDCDGSPEIVENNLPHWLENGGRVCFWRYRLQKQLSIEEVTWGELNK